MVCIYCGGETKVANSRLQKKTNQIWRRRLCLACGAIFTTEEQAVTDTSLLFIPKIGRSEPFLREKLLLSVYEALRHRKTAISDATALCDTIWQRLLPYIQSASLDRDHVVQVSSDVLKKFDQAAATTYLAYHPLKK